MCGKYKKFHDLYNRKIKSDKDIEQREVSFHNDDRERITFSLNVSISTPKIITIDTSAYIFTLDDEDLKYLYDKYSKRLVDEKNNRIKEIEDEYKDV